MTAKTARKPGIAGTSLFERTRKAAAGVTTAVSKAFDGVTGAEAIELRDEILKSIAGIIPDGKQLKLWMNQLSDPKAYPFSIQLFMVCRKNRTKMGTPSIFAHSDGPGSWKAMMSVSTREGTRMSDWQTGKNRAAALELAAKDLLTQLTVS